MDALEIKNFTLSFRMYTSGIRRTDLKVITDLNLTLREGEIHAVIGSSGSGKSLLAHAILGILPQNAVSGGEMLWYGEKLTPKLQKKLRGNQIALVPQSVTYMDPLMKVGKQISRDRQAAREALAKYELGEEVDKMYPFELSGGMARRVLVATAAVSNAKVIIADEPTPGLSASLAETAMARFRQLAENGRAVLLITHDLELAQRYADRITVFYAGNTLETTAASNFEKEELLHHPYSRALWRAMPANGFVPTPGTQPYAGRLPEGCPYAERCERRTEACSVRPEPKSCEEGEVSCHNAY